MLVDKEAILRKCRLCPRNCGINRLEQPGLCGGGKNAIVARLSLHPWEEPIISGEDEALAAGTVFFSGCNLRCVFCQNYEISHRQRGKTLCDEDLGVLFLAQAAKGAVSLDLVTPTHYAPQIINAVDFARKRGMKLPVVYNSSGYEKASTIDMLQGTVDVYLPDLKYFDSKLSMEYAQAEDYFAVASAAITKMVEQVGKPQFDANGIMTRGVMVRHLVLPGARKDSMKLLDWLWHSFGDDIYLSLMSQYTPMYRAKEFHHLKRRLTTFEYNSVVDYSVDLGFTRGFIQELESASEVYVPDWQEIGF